VADGVNPRDRVVVEGKEVFNSGQPLQVAETYQHQVVNRNP